MTIHHASMLQYVTYKGVEMTAIINALNDKMSQDKINQTQLATKLGIKQCLLSQIINNRRRPSLVVTKAIYREYPDLAEILLR